MVGSYAVASDGQGEFPYTEALASINVASPIETENFLATLDSFGLSYGIAHECLTEKNTVLLGLLNQPDSIAGWKELIRLSEFYTAYAPYSKRDSILHLAIADYWFSAVKTKVSLALEQNPDLVRDAGYKYLIERLGENKFSVETPTPSSIEKAFDNFSKGRFGYVLQRFWVDSPWYILLLAFVGGIIFMVGAFTTFSKIKQTITR